MKSALHGIGGWDEQKLARSIVDSEGQLVLYAVIVPCPTG